MGKFRNYQTNFSGGLLSEGMLGRLDLAQYENGCKQLENWWPKVTGGMRRRPGSLFLSAVAGATRIESFIFNESQTYIVAFVPTGVAGDEIQVYDPDDGSLVDSISYTDLTATIIDEMSVTQRADVMFLTHEDMEITEIRRTSATTFTAATYEFENHDSLTLPKKCPFVNFADIGTTLEASAVTGSVTLTTKDASGSAYNFFLAEHVNTRIQYRGKQLKITAVSAPPASTCTATVIEELDAGATLTFAGGAVDNPQDFIIGEIVVGRTSGIKAEVMAKTSTTITVAMIAGVFPASPTEELEGLDSGNIATLTGKSSVAPQASTWWAVEAFSDYYGWPSCVEFHAQRLWFSGGSSLPAHLFGSRVAAFFNFDVGDAFPADSIQVVISSNQINKITNIVSGRHLQIFTDAGEFYAPQSVDAPLIPETFDLLQQTRYGSKKNLAKNFDESTIFAQQQGNAIREYIWIDGRRGYSSDGISLIAEEHLNDVQELEVLYGGYDRPEQIAFFVNGDGTITWYHAARAEGIRSWGKWTTQGNYKSLTVIADKLYALVERTINAVTVLHLERFELTVTVDCAVQAQGSASSTWAAVHADLLNTEVDVVHGVTAYDPDYFLGKYTLDATGDLDVSPLSVDNVTVGLGFTQTLETMPIEIKDQQGVSGGMPKRIVNADIYLASSLAVQLEGNRVSTFQAGDDLTVAPSSITGLRKFYLLGYSERPTLTVVNEIPVPCEALSLGAEVEY